jgi:GT2 family glycosyltransferase
MLDVYGVPFCRGRVFDTFEEDRGQYDSTVEVFWASGAALFARTEAVKKAGLLDPLLYAHMEEIDLCWRMRLLGYKVVCVPDSVVYHWGGGTNIKGKWYLKQRNNIIVMIKNYGLGSLSRYLPRRVVLDVLSMLYFLASGERERVLYTIKAYFWILRNLRAVIAARFRTQRLRRVSDAEVLKAMCKSNVSIQYYLLKRRMFSRIHGLPLPLKYYLAINTTLCNV